MPLSTIQLKAALQGLQAIAFDVDGVLTDGTLLWSPTGEARAFTQTLGSTPGRLVAAQRMPLTNADAALSTPVASRDRDGNVVTEVTESPLYLFFEKQ